MAKAKDKKSGKKPPARSGLRGVIDQSLEPPLRAITPPEKVAKKKK